MYIGRHSVWDDEKESLLVEGGSAPLDESLGLFEEGVALVKFCNSKLDKAEAAVKKLVPSGDGYTETDMD